MPVLVTAIIAGLVAVQYARTQLSVAILVLCLATLVLVYGHYLQHSCRHRPWLDLRCRLWLMVLSGVIAGSGSALYHDHSLAVQRLPVVVTGDQWLEGTIVDREQRTDSVRLWLERCSIVGQEWAPAADDQVLLTLYQQTTAALPGDRVRLQARLKEPVGYRVPGAFDYALFLRRQGVIATAYGRSVVERLPSLSPDPWQQAFWNRWRVIVSQAIASSLSDYPARIALTEAILVGYRGRMDGSMRDHFQAAGTFHLIAISGMQLTLAGAGFFYLIRLLLVVLLPSLSRRWDVKPVAAALALMPLWIYATLAGWSVATQRALVMAVLLLLAMISGRTQQSWRALAIAVVILLLWYPWQLFEAGFQLSFVATAVLIWSGSWFARLRQGFIVRWVVGSVVTTTLVWLATLPIVLHHFHFLAPWSVLANLVAMLLAGPVTVIAGLAALLVLPFSDAAAGQLFNVVGQLMELVWHWSIWISTLPGSWIRWPGPTQTGLVFIMTAILIMMTAGMGRTRLLGLPLMLIGCYGPHPAPTDGQLHVALLDVGQAQSAVIRTPAGQWSVIDAGGSYTDRFDIGEVISAYLWHYGVTRLERLIISHTDQDHVAGAERLLRNFAVARIWTGVGHESDQQNDSYNRLLRRAEQQQVTVQRWSEAHQEQEGDVSLRLLPPVPITGRHNNNNSALVVEVTLKHHRLLFPSDLESRGEQWLLKQQALRPVTVLVAPHHGSRSSSSMAFIQATRPRHVLFSVGAGNRYRLPVADVVTRWRTVAPAIWRTDQRGTIELTTDGQWLRFATSQ
ncbi:MAG: DNA internalization-related competence protein ComEC/Rec2 [Magnetococcales bacterium]|nr:DNA internalization-related competence protein ComEC/Rec2 [Magnetococcales bacterium]